CVVTLIGRNVSPAFIARALLHEWKPLYSPTGGIQIGSSPTPRRSSSSAFTHRNAAGLLEAALQESSTSPQLSFLSGPHALNTPAVLFSARRTIHSARSRTSITWIGSL